MPLIAQLPDGSLWLLGADGLYHELSSIGQVFDLGFDYSSIVEWNDELPAPVGDPVEIADGLASVEPAPPPPPPPTDYPIGPTPVVGQDAAASPPPASSPSSFAWGIDAAGDPLVWRQGDTTRFIAYLEAHGVAYYAWANNHPAAAAILNGPEPDPLREPASHSLGQALAAAIVAGDTPEEAAQRVEALRAALVKAGVSGVTRAQLLADAKIVASTIAAARATPPPEGAPAIDEPAEPGDRSLQSVNAADRGRADVSGLPTVPQGVPVTRQGLVTEVAVVAAALITHSDVWIALGTCKVESGFTVQRGGNSAGAVGPMQIVGFPKADDWPNEIVFVWANLIAGCRMLANYEAAYDGNQAKVSAAYNAGAGAVNTHWPEVLRYFEVLGHPEAGRVQDYVDSVALWAGRYRAEFGAGYSFDPDTGKLTNGVAPKADEPPPLEPPGVPAGVAGRWRELVDVFADTVPERRQALHLAADSLIEVIK